MMYIYIPTTLLVADRLLAGGHTRIPAVCAGWKFVACSVWERQKNIVR